MPSQLTRVLATVVSTALLASCAHAPNGRYVPPELLSKPASDLAEGIAVFGDGVQKETLSGYRRAARQDLIRTSIYAYFTAKDWPATGPRLPEPDMLLCKPRYGYLRIAGPLQNTTARGTAIKELLKAPSDSLGDLFKALGEKYRIDPTEVTVEGRYDDWSGHSGKSCIEAITKADPFLTRDDVGEEAGGVIPAGKLLFDTVWGVIKPALKSGLQNVDRERRNKAVQEYFANTVNANGQEEENPNVKAMRDDIAHVERFLENEFSFAQQRAAGEAVAQYIAFRDPDAAHWKAAMAAANAPGCQAAIRGIKQPPGWDPPAEKGITCLTKVYDALNPAISKVLDAGDKVDASLDKTLPKDKLSDQIGTVAKIANGKAPSDAEAKALWGALTRYASLYNSAKDAGSEANQKKIKDAAEAFAKAL